MGKNRVLFLKNLIEAIFDVKMIIILKLLKNFVVFHYMCIRIMFDSEFTFL